LTDLTRGHQLKSEAITTLSGLQQAISLAKSKISSETPKSQIEPLSQIVNRAIKMLGNCQIEKDLARANSKQLLFIDTFLTEARKPIDERKYKEFALVGGNRSGKSFGGRMAFAKYVRDYAAPYGIYWCVSPNDDVSIRGPQKEVWEALPRWMFGEQEWNEKNGFAGKHNTLVLDKGRRNIIIKFKSEAQWENNPRAFEQEKVSGIWIDESVKEAAYLALRPRTIDMGAWIMLTCIPDEPWIHDEFEEAAPDSRKLYVKIAMMDNHLLPQSEIQDALNNWPEDEIDMRVFGNFRYLKGLVYKEFIKEYDPKGHLVKPFKIPPEWPRWRMMDIGMDHPTVLLWMAAAPDETLFIYREYVSRKTSVAMDCDAIKELSAGEKYASHCIIDPSAYAITKANPVCVAHQYDACGLKCRPGIRTATYGEMALVMKIKKRLEDRNIMVFDTCKHLITEFRKWRYKTDPRTGLPTGKDAFEDRNNDALDALKYGVANNPCFSQMGAQFISTCDD